VETSRTLPEQLQGESSIRQQAEQSVGYWLSVTTQAYHRAVAEETAPHGITYRQSMVIGSLMLEGELSQAELAAKMMVEPPTLVGILDRMQRDGWITRHNCPSDRRKKLVRLTPAVAPVWGKIKECLDRIRDRATRGLDESELESLKRILRRIHENVDGLDHVEILT